MQESENYQGKVYLVGAGPGDPGLITVKGLECLRNADAVVYDRLASPRLLAEARSDAELYDAGKGRDNHRMTQDEINHLLIELGVQGKTVCRLKGGDPFVFGRGGEEALELAAAGIPWEVVPGISSTIAAPAYAGIPVTQRGMSTSLTIVTGSEDPNKSDSTINWDALAGLSGTLVFVMGWKAMDDIVNALITRGVPGDRPSALVQWGTTASQLTVTGPVSEIVATGLKAGIGAPVALVIGEVAGLREALAWFDNRPLFGKRVLVTRARSQASRLVAKLEELGAEVLEYPAIEIVPVRDPSPLDAALRNISAYDWMMFTSSNAVRGITERMRVIGIDSRALAHLKFGVIGPSTARALAGIGITPDAMPDDYISSAMVDLLTKMDSIPSNVLFPRSEIGRETLANGLREIGVQVEEVIAYSTETPDDTGDLAREAYERGIDFTTFTSSSTVRNLVGLLGGSPDLINTGRNAVIGPITAETALELGVNVDIQAEERSIDGLVDAITLLARNGSATGANDNGSAIADA
ncbi:MAG: uroporphyrinogen-III C-methyltransferase [Dehalococcoidia bacterium]|jgi:uroporphyrinogen III methyltransferase/synthase|nr:uroporphyrinogen-III C-methyltransferase [Dehalococcoidia bacterium]